MALCLLAENSIVVRNLKPGGSIMVWACFGVNKEKNEF